MIIRRCLFVGISIAAGYLGFCASDRQPPYILQNGVASPDPAAPGAPVHIESDVIVYKSGCKGVFQRTITDAGGYPWAFPPAPTQFNELLPGKYRVATPIQYVLPIAIASGSAYSITETTFQCPWNILHRWWPIRVTTPRVKFTVAPR